MLYLSGLVVPPPSKPKPFDQLTVYDKLRGIANPLRVKILAARPGALAKSLAGEGARAPAVHPWSHGDLAVVFSSSKPKPFNQLAVYDKLRGIEPLANKITPPEIEPYQVLGKP